MNSSSNEMTPIQALQVLFEITKLAPIVEKDRILRDQAANVLQALVKKTEESVTKEEAK